MAFVETRYGLVSNWLVSNWAADSGPRKDIDGQLSWRTRQTRVFKRSS